MVLPFDPLCIRHSHFINAIIFIANDTTQLEVVLPGRPEDYTVNDADDVIHELNERLHLPRHAITLTGVGEGSVVLIFQLPIRWKHTLESGQTEVIHVADRLQELVNGNTHWLRERKVIGVHIEGLPYLDLKGISGNADVCGKYFTDNISHEMIHFHTSYLPILAHDVLMHNIKRQNILIQQNWKPNFIFG